MSQIVEEAGVRTRAETLLGPIKQRIESGKRDRGRFEPVWHSNRAFAAGKQWLRWSRSDRRLRLDPKDVEHGQERYTVDILTQNLWTAFGQLSGAEARRQLLFRKEDVPSEDFAKAANSSLAYGWEYEWLAPKQLAAVKRKLLVDGTAAIQAYFDPNAGKSLGEVPVGDGEPFTVLGDPQNPAPPEEVPTQPGAPITDGAHARAYMAERMGQGVRPKMREIKEGRVCWHPRSVFQLIVPPGIEDEDNFPWEATVEAVRLDKLQERWPDTGQGVNEEPLAVLEQIGLKDSVDSGYGADPEADSGTPGKLEGHVALVTYFERPSTKYPRGRVVYYAGNKLLEVVNTLPYQRPNGDWHSGLVYFHYWRIEGRFWGRGLIEPGKGIQRAYNKRIQQEHLTINRGQPYVMAEENGDVKMTDAPVEVVNYPQGTQRPPVAVPGIPVHDAIWKSKEGLLEDLERAMGIHGVSTGEAPSRQTTYAELALRAEKDRTKLDPIFEDFQASVAILTELAIQDIREHWNRDKIIAIAGEEEYAEAVSFDASSLPTFFQTELAEGDKPRTQAAQIQLITDLWNADQALIPTGTNRLDLSWYKASLEAGKALDFPESDKDVQTQRARWENSEMIAKRQPAEVAYFDPPDVHIPIHREAQIEALTAGDLDLYEVLERHVQVHTQQADENARKAAEEQARAQEELDAAQAGDQQQQEQVAAEADHQRQLEVNQQQADLAPEPTGQAGSK